MEANELRIGNWVNVGYNKQFDLDDFENYFGEWKAFSNDAIEPIPLTPEILEKAGFEDVKYAWKLEVKDSGFIVMHNNDKASFVTGDYDELGFQLKYEIKYLHQLQNIYFALTGKELEINL